MKTLIKTIDFIVDEDVDIEKYKPFFYGIIFPMVMLLLTHSFIGMISIQTLLFFVQKNIQKDNKKARETLKIFVFLNLSFIIFILPVILFK